MADHIIKMSELKAVRGNHHLKTSSLGSCVGIILYDKYEKIGGMAHIMLPFSLEDDDHIGRYANKAIPALIQQMGYLGAKPSHLKAMMFGGADMFFSVSSTTSMMKIGFRNIEACRKLLEELHIPIEQEDIGGSIGRSVHFNCPKGIVSVENFNDEKIQFLF